MEQSMTIRPATEADLATITRLFAETIRAVNARHYNEEQVRVWAEEKLFDSRIEPIKILYFLKLR
jgi:L-amino acid N-acyltransferase YncA